MKDGSFLPESNDLERNDWSSGARYAARFDETDREEIRKILGREGIEFEQIRSFLDRIESGPLTENLANLHFTQNSTMVKEWVNCLEKTLSTYHPKFLIKTLGGRKTILAYLQEQKSISAKNIAPTLHKSPRKALRLLRSRRPPGRPPDILTHTLEKSACSLILAIWAETFHKEPPIHPNAPIVMTACHLLALASRSSSHSKIVTLLRDQKSSK